MCACPTKPTSLLHTCAGDGFCHSDWKHCPFNLPCALKHVQPTAYNQNCPDLQNFGILSMLVQPITSPAQYLSNPLLVQPTTRPTHCLSSPPLFQPTLVQSTTRPTHNSDNPLVVQPTTSLLRHIAPKCPDADLETVRSCLSGTGHTQHGQTDAY